MARPRFFSLLLPLALAACVGHVQTRPPAPATPVLAPDKPKTARAAGVEAGPSFDSLSVPAEAAVRALQAFRLSCGALQRPADGSGLTQASDWQAPCAAAMVTPDQEAATFFATQLEVARIGDGRAFATGYYEPEIAGSRTPAPGYAVPIYKRPADLVEVDLGLFSESLKGRRIRGRVVNNQLLPYADRAEIVAGGLAGRGLELAYAADAIDFFFLQVQGSGRLKLPDGSIMRIGYDGQNGRDYTAIGKVMREKGLLAPGDANMAGIVRWLRANPDQAQAVMNKNKSWVFSKELTGPGPLGALGLPVTGRATVAADPLFVPLGAPIFLQTDRPEANGLWVAQDTGGAIKGPNRFDTFWGAGAEAEQIAGGMMARGVAYVLVPKGTVARLKAQTQP
ncbi:MAG: murein transglycosylase A [Chakrabartia sp.]